ncbi:type 1 fimbria pilin [Pseudomonas sp. JUb42]|jgi:type 1 fimbria pilin|uniref:DUF2790 domain-containing protein n=1 Tax=Pseudomonas sp. JUb42 TaxID=2940611 RepID=UPI0021687387|nr:DUF2790 domain-containing protein [Pseudomonas sp. JUb42]MCS3469112.1 type 1 fimbria pilin [Pseudomonas sp. JUb42]
MNSKVAAFALIVLASSSVMAAENSNVPDIQHVVSTTAVPGSCQVEPATMVYLDSQGVSHTVTYRVMGTCQGGV